MAEGDVAPNGNSGGAVNSSATRDRTVGKGHAAISSTRRCDQRWSDQCFFPEGIFSLVKGIADTGFIVAFARANDQHHRWAVDIARRITEPLLTCEAVLAESAFHLESSSYVFSLVLDEMLQISFDCGRNVEQLAELAERYRDRKPDLADLCLIRMSELHPRHSVITVDSDFRVYRRNKRDAIPVICPPK
ncbi:MAG TPA: PIN domain-containing protein [Candidatus Sulfotelmatobacter sp.]|jgi:predicted nucleic acid-binding protein|nr:PIN domain-containing protein [Candidatus Sulfotelmatobacter sp.]